jgi:hypothetical protein
MPGSLYPGGVAISLQGTAYQYICNLSCFRGSIPERQIPVQLDFMGNMRVANIPETADIPQGTAHATIETTGRHVDILGLDLHLFTAALA